MIHLKKENFISLILHLRKSRNPLTLIKVKHSNLVKYESYLFFLCKGAITKIALSRDESAILTAAEDGQLKIWSKTGLLRNTIATEPSPIHCCGWSSDVQERILYSTNDQLSIRPLAPNSKTIKWVAHKGRLTILF